MITCYLRYEIDPDKVAGFEDYTKLWIPLVERFGGTHHGYFLPHESANDLAIALFSFPSLAAYETYSTKSLEDQDCKTACELAPKPDAFGALTDSSSGLRRERKRNPDQDVLHAAPGIPLDL